MRWINFIRKFYYESFGIDNKEDIYKLFRLYYLFGFIVSPLFVFYLFYKEDDLFIDVFIPIFFLSFFILSYKSKKIKNSLSEILFATSFLFCGYALYYYYINNGDLSYFIGFLIAFLSLNIIIHYYDRALIFSLTIIISTIIMHYTSNEINLIPLQYCLSALISIALIIFLIHYNREVLLLKINESKKDIYGSRDRLLTVINSIDNIVYHVAIDEKGNKSLRYLSGQIENILNMKVDEYISLSKTGKILEFVHPEDLNNIIEKTKELNHIKKPVTMKYRFKIPNQEQYIWVEEKVFPKFDETGKHIANIGISSNITDRVIKEQQILHSEEKYRTMIEKNLSGFYRIDLNRIIIECNNSFAEIFGFTDKKLLIGKSLDDLYKDSTDRNNFIELLKEKKYIKNHESKVVLKSEREIWLLENVSYIADGTGYIEGTVFDITQFKNTQQALAKSEELYKSLFESNVSGVFRTRINGEIIDCNEAFIKIFGYADKKEFLKLRSDDLYFSNNDRNKYIEDLKRNKILKNYELLVKKKDNTPVTILANVSLLKDEQGMEAIIQGTLIDITAHKLAEKERIRANIIEESNIQLQKEIEEHKLTQQKLTQQKQYIDTVLNSSIDMIMATNANNEIYQVNDAALKCFGYTFDEIKGKSPKILYANKKDYLRVSKELKKNHKFVGEIKNIRKNGEVFTCYLSASVMLSKEGEFIGAMGVSRDITQIIESEKLVQKQTAKIKSIFESASNILIWTLDKNFKISSFNNNFFEEVKKHFGIETYVGLPFNEYLINFINKDYNTQTLSIYQNAFKGEHQELEGKMYDLKGKKIWYEVFVSPIKLADGTIQEVSCIAHNITDKKETQLKLAKSEEQSRALISALPDLIFRMKKDGTYLDVIYKNNNLLLEKTENFIGKKITERFNNEMGNAFLKNIQNCIDNNKIYQYEYSLNINNYIGYFEARYAKINDDEALVIIRDITEKKTAEQELLTSLKEKEILLKEVHHRVKNNLQVISSILNLQSSYIKDEKILQILRESQNRIKSMSFIHESLYQNKNFSYINFTEYINNLSKNLFLTYQVGEENINLIFETDYIHLNLDQAIPCGLIINELLSNALKYAFNKNIKQPQIKIGLKQKENQISIIIEDNGIGMPPEFDIKHTETLGIQLVTTLVEQLDGEIKQESGQGTKYLITFEKQLIN
jgi:PAS domain S-box-containing protein